MYQNLRVVLNWCLRAVKRIDNIRLLRHPFAYRVIIGAKLKKVNQIIHIQIQEGQILPRGGINISTIEWKPIDEFTTMSTNVKNGVDYHQFMWEKRAVDLDDLLPPKDHLLTGITRV